MISYPEVAHQLPEVFERKIAVDKAIEMAFETDVIPMTLFVERDALRISCQAHIKRQRGTGGGAGTG